MIIELGKIQLRPSNTHLECENEQKVDSNVSVLENTTPVDGEVEPHQLSELGVTVAQHVGEVVGPVQVGVDGADTAAFAVQVTINLGSDAGQLSNQVHGVLINKLEDEMIKSIRKWHVNPGKRGKVTSRTGAIMPFMEQ